MQFDIDRFKNWVLRCTMLNVPASYGGLRFEIGGSEDNIKCIGLDLAELRRHDLNKTIYTEFIELGEKCSITVSFPFQMDVDWNSLEDNILSLYKLSAYIAHQKFQLQVNGLMEFGGFEKIGIFKALYLADSVNLKDRALLNSQINILKAPKVTSLGEMCLCGCNELHIVYLNSINRVGTKVLKNLRYIDKVSELVLADNYVIEDVDASKLRNGRNSVYSYLDISQFKELSLTTLQYLFTHSREDLHFKNLTKVFVDKKGVTSNLRYAYGAATYTFDKLVEIPSYMFVKHNYFPTIELPSAVRLNRSSFVCCHIDTLCIPKVDHLEPLQFEDSDIITCYMTGMKVVDLSLITVLNTLYVSENAEVINNFNDDLMIYRIQGS